MPRLSQFNGSEIFLDANILLYDFSAHPRFGASCHKLIEKTELGQLRSFTSHWVITEVVHKLMLLETCDRFHLAMHAAVNYLKKYPRSIQSLSQYRQALDLLMRLPNLIILEVNHPIFFQSHQLISKYQLLSSDAIHVATCLAYGIKHLATNDKDFKRAKEITVWTP
jgi:predicted nucleic acid-binding protein